MFGSHWSRVRVLGSPSLAWKYLRVLGPLCGEEGGTVSQIWGVFDLSRAGRTARRGGDWVAFLLALISFPEVPLRHSGLLCTLSSLVA